MEQGHCTTLQLDPAVLAEAEASYGELGFACLEDLISAAINWYLDKRAYDRAMDSLRRAASDPEYVKVVREISEDFKYADAENLPPPY